MELHNCPCSGKTLARLVHPAVMAVLAAEPIHGYLILQRLSGMRIFCGQRPDPTGVYRVLKAMEQEGLVRSTVEATDNRPAKRCFALTASGRKCLARWGGTLQDYEESISDLLTIITHARRTRRSVAKKSTRRTAECSRGTGCCGSASPK